MTGELSQFLGRLQRLAHTQPELSAFNAQGVFQSEVRPCTFHTHFHKQIADARGLGNGADTYYPDALALQQNLRFN
jgi:hypothetical protein